MRLEWFSNGIMLGYRYDDSPLVWPDGTPAPPDMPQPAKMVVMGDAVYLRWEYPRGYQEDSLLLANEDRRLEGTFKNSAGDWGAITGKRIAPCAR